MEGGKPVVCIWGMGFPDRPGDVTSWKDVVDWFKGQGCYVIGGLRSGFHSDAANQAAYKACDMVMVWYVGKKSNFDTALRKRPRVVQCEWQGLSGGYLSRNRLLQHG